MKDLAGKVVSRSGYPIWLSRRANELIGSQRPPQGDPAKVIGESAKELAARRDHAPRLTEMKNYPTKLRVAAAGKSVSFTEKDYLPGGTQKCATAIVEVANIGPRLAFHTGIEITNADCRYLCDDNYFILMPGETKRVTFQIDRSIDPFNERVKPEVIQPMGDTLEFTARAWNADPETIRLATVLQPQEKERTLTRSLASLQWWMICPFGRPGVCSRTILGFR